MTKNTARDQLDMLSVLGIAPPAPGWIDERAEITAVEVACIRALSIAYAIAGCAAQNAFGDRPSQLLAARSLDIERAAYVEVEDAIARRLLAFWGDTAEETSAADGSVSLAAGFTPARMHPQVRQALRDLVTFSTANGAVQIQIVEAAGFQAA